MYLYDSAFIQGALHSLVDPIHPFTHQWRRKPCKVPTSHWEELGVKCLAQGHNDTNSGASVKHMLTCWIIYFVPIFQDNTDAGRICIIKGLDLHRCHLLQWGPADCVKEFIVNDWLYSILYCTCTCFLPSTKVAVFWLCGKLRFDATVSYSIVIHSCDITHLGMRLTIK